jgi:hypothetical protein
MQIDHLIYAAPDLEAAVADVERRFGVRATGGGQHLGMGTHNKLLALGPRTYLEIVAPDPGQPEPDGPRPYGVDGVTAPGMVGWVLASNDIEGALSRARTAGFDPGDVIAGHRVTPSGTTLRWRSTANAMTAGVIPFLISWGDTPHPASSAPAGLTLASFRIERPDPGAIQTPLHALGAEVDVRPASEIALIARITGPLGVDELR